MDAVVKLVQEKVGLSESQARQAVETVVGFLKEKLPAPVATQIDAVMGGKGGDTLQRGADALGGILGRGKR